MWFLIRPVLSILFNAHIPSTDVFYQKKYFAKAPDRVSDTRVEKKRRMLMCVSRTETEDHKNETDYQKVDEQIKRFFLIVV